MKMLQVYRSGPQGQQIPVYEYTCNVCGKTVKQEGEDLPEDWLDMGDDYHLCPDCQEEPTQREPSQAAEVDAAKSKKDKKVKTGVKAGDGAAVLEAIEDYPLE